MNKRHISKVAEDIKKMLHEHGLNVFAFLPEVWLLIAVNAEQLGQQQLAENQFKCACLAEEAANA